MTIRSYWHYEKFIIFSLIIIIIYSRLLII